MYHFPQPYVCKKCGHKTEWSPDVFTELPVVSSEDGRRAPICPKCWNKWLEETFGAMEREKK